MHEVMSGYRDYKAMMGGVSVGAIVVMEWQLLRRMNEVPDELKGAYKLWALYLAGGFVLICIFLVGYLNSQH